MKKKKPLIIAPSIFSADFGKLADEAKRIEDSGADEVHVDVMDGHFVPNFALSPKGIAAINRSTDLFLDVHIMIYNPFDYIERFVDVGADRITFHFEATEDVEETLKYIRRCNIQAGLAFSPETSASLITKYLNKCDQILLMTVNPGFGGQEFLPEVLDKIRFTRETLDKLNIRKGGVTVAKNPEETPEFNIQVDGGINDKTAKLCVEAGANSIVAGTYLFCPEMRQRIQLLRSLR